MNINLNGRTRILLLRENLFLVLFLKRFDFVTSFFGGCLSFGFKLFSFFLLLDLFGHVAGESALNLVELFEAILGDDTFPVVQIVFIATIGDLFLMGVGGVSSLSHWVCPGPDAGASFA